MKEERLKQIEEMATEVAKFITADRDFQCAFRDCLRRGAIWADEHPYQEDNEKDEKEH